MAKIPVFTQQPGIGTYSHACGTVILIHVTVCRIAFIFFIFEIQIDNFANIEKDPSAHWLRFRQIASLLLSDKAAITDRFFGERNFRCCQSVSSDCHSRSPNVNLAF